MALSWKNKVTRNFDVHAHMYEQYGDVQTKVADNLACDLPCLEKANILEIGCGTGFLSRHLIKNIKGRGLILLMLALVCCTRPKVYFQTEQHAFSF